MYDLFGEEGSDKSRQYLNFRSSKISSEYLIKIAQESITTNQIK